MARVPWRSPPPTAARFLNPVAMREGLCCVWTGQASWCFTLWRPTCRERQLMAAIMGWFIPLRRLEAEVVSSLVRARAGIRAAARRRELSVRARSRAHDRAGLHGARCGVLGGSRRRELCTAALVSCGAQRQSPAGRHGGACRSAAALATNRRTRSIIEAQSFRNAGALSHRVLSRRIRTRHEGMRRSPPRKPPLMAAG